MKMKSWRTGGAAACVMAMLSLLVLPLMAEQANSERATSPSGEAAQPDEPAAEGRAQVRAATLIYADGKTSECFASGFLDTVARQTDVPVARSFSKVELASETVFQFPFAIMTGEGDFKLSEAEIDSLRTYVDRGGFLLASAGCSDARWAGSFKAAIAEAYPDNKLGALKMTHPVFHTLYDIKELTGMKKAVKEPLQGLEIDGRLGIVFSPHGLNDTANAGGGCCCCGGNEVRDANLLNANILMYALTH